MMMMEGCRASGGKHGHTSVFCRSEAFFLRYLLSRTRILRPRGRVQTHIYDPVVFFCTLLRAGQRKTLPNEDVTSPYI